MKKIQTVKLTTPFAEKMGETPWSEYPRPTLVRDSYLSLNGEWELCSDSYNGAVTVPFPPESLLSGVGREVGEEYSCKRKFSLPAGFVKDRVIVHFGAVDAEAVVIINGREAGHHVGGYLAFSFDVTELLRESENEIEVKVRDSLDTELPYGKQSRKRGGMWYTPISGIWQSVWLESVPNSYIERLEITPSLDSVQIKVTGGEAHKRLTLEGGEVYEFDGDVVTVSVADPINWTPETPKLYRFTLECGEDCVRSYFALRTVETKENRILLNGKPYFFHGLLDQGYFSDGIYTPATPEGYEFDILKMKELGFNMLRKHIKVEPELFYYYCDKHGMAVFQDFVNSGKYNFIIDTALPTVGLKRGVSHRASKKRRERFEADGLGTQKQLFNHPSVCCYTIFNEGWGQYDADRLYRFFKQNDPSRFYDATSGWFFERDSDVDSHHVYFKPIKLKPSQKPLVLSEFGGYSCKIEGHSFNLSKTYGYKFFEKREDFEDALVKLYLDEVVPSVRQGLCAAVLTQVSDVEDETNGLVTYDRRTVKVDAARMQAVKAEIDKAFNV